MTPDQKDIIKNLFNGHWLRKTRNHNRKTVYKVFDAAGNPVSYIFPRTIERIDKHFGFSIFKGNPKEKITLHLANIRRLHGRTWLKQTYKYYAKKKQLENRLKK